MYFFRSPGKGKGRGRVAEPPKPGTDPKGSEQPRAAVAVARDGRRVRQASGPVVVHTETETETVTNVLMTQRMIDLHEAQSLVVPTFDAERSVYAGATFSTTNKAAVPADPKTYRWDWMGAARVLVTPYAFGDRWAPSGSGSGSESESVPAPEKLCCTIAGVTLLKTPISGTPPQDAPTLFGVEGATYTVAAWKGAAAETELNEIITASSGFNDLVNAFYTKGSEDVDFTVSSVLKPVRLTVPKYTPKPDVGFVERSISGITDQYEGSYAASSLDAKTEPLWEATSAYVPFSATDTIPVLTFTFTSTVTVNFPLRVKGDISVSAVVTQEPLSDALKGLALKEITFPRSADNADRASEIVLETTTVRIPVLAVVAVDLPEDQIQNVYTSRDGKAEVLNMTLPVALKLERQATD